MKKDRIIELIKKDKTVSYTEKEGKILVKLSKSIELEIILGNPPIVFINAYGLVPFEVEYATNYVMRFVNDPMDITIVIPMEG